VVPEATYPSVALPVTVAGTLRNIIAEEVVADLHPRETLRGLRTSTTISRPTPHTASRCAIRAVARGCAQQQPLAVAFNVDVVDGVVDDIFVTRPRRVVVGQGLPSRPPLVPEV
jgi:hypothetical protein